MYTSIMEQYQKMLDDLEKQNKDNMDRLRTSLGAVIPKTPEDTMNAILERLVAIEKKLDLLVS